jgi:hypothetical protein
MNNFFYGKKSKIFSKAEFFTLDSIAEFASSISWLCQEEDLEL